MEWRESLSSRGYAPLVSLGRYDTPSTTNVVPLPLQQGQASLRKAVFMASPVGEAGLNANEVRWKPDEVFNKTRRHTAQLAIRYACHTDRGKRVECISRLPCARGAPLKAVRGCHFIRHSDYCIIYLRGIPLNGGRPAPFAQLHQHFYLKK